MRLARPFFRLPGQRRRPLVLALLLASCPATAAAGAPPPFGSAPPWSIEAPAAAEGRFSLGLELVFERQEGLRIAAFDQLVEVVDLLSGEQHTSRLPGDPELLNRKFDLVFERASVAPSFALALPSAGFFGVGQLYPTLTVSAAAGDVRLDFDDRTEPRDSTSLRGRGALFETRLDVVTTLCRSCPWYAAASYGFEKLPALTVDRSPGILVHPGSSVPRDEVRLKREVHEVESRVGYTTAGGRTASFVGVQHRWSDVDVDDHLVVRDLFAETRLASRTRLEGEATLAVAGVNVALGGGFFGRLETAVGDGDSLARVAVLYLPGKDRGRRRATEIARQIVPRLAEVLEWFRAERGRLAVAVVDGVEVYSLAAVRRLLVETEERVLGALREDELAPLREHVSNRFEAARAELRAVGTSGAAAPPRRNGLLLTATGERLRTRSAAVSRDAPASAAAGPSQAPRGQVDGILDRVGAKIAQLLQMGRDDDLAAVALCILSKPNGAQFAIYLESGGGKKPPITTADGYPGIYRGDWLYSVSLSGYKALVDQRLDLVDDSRSILDCQLVEESVPGTRVCQRKAGDPAQECGLR